MQITFGKVYVYVRVNFYTVLYSVEKNALLRLTYQAMQFGTEEPDEKHKLGEIIIRLFPTTYYHYKVLHNKLNVIHCLNYL